MQVINNHQFSINGIIDFVVITLMVTFPMSIVGVYTVDLIPIPYGINWFVFILLAYICRFGHKLSLFSQLKNYPLLFLFFTINILDIVQGVFMGNILVISQIIPLVTMYFFSEYLFALYHNPSINNNPLDKISKPYSVYALYNAITIIICAIFIVAGVVSPFSNSLENNRLISDNVSKGALYYFPGYLSIALDSYRLWYKLGVPLLTGLSHEPHVLCYLVFPALFLYMGKNYGSKIICFTCITIIILVALLSTSAIAIFTLCFILVIHFVWKALIHKKYIWTVLIFFIAFFLLQSIDLQDNILIQFLTAKTDESTSSGGSLSYSRDMLLYIIQPKSIIGYGNIPPEIGSSILQYSIGLLTSILDVLLYGWFVFKATKLVISNNPNYHFRGLACLYFAVHTLKLSCLTFSYPIFLFFIFILSVEPNSIQNDNSISNPMLMDVQA